MSWKSDYKKIKEYRKTHKAPVDSLGAHALPKENGQIFRYQALISVLLSSKTRDEATAKAMGKLQKHGLNINNILKTSESEIKELIKDVGFYNVKAKYIKNITEVLHNDYNDDIPKTIKELLRLKGIGPKMSTLIMLITWNKITGISVDSHIHRIVNVLGWVDTKNAKETKDALEQIVPRKYWREFNRILVGFGQLMKSSKNIKEFFQGRC